MPTTIQELANFPETFSIVDLKVAGIGSLVDQLSAEGFDGGEAPTVKELKTFLNNIEEGDEKDRWLQLQVDASPPAAPGASPTIDPAAIKDLATPDKTEKFSRQIIGALFCLVAAFTLLVFTVTIAIVAIDRKEFPPTGLSLTIVGSSMMVTWYCMGIINKERRDMLSAVVGDKINSSTLGDVITAIRTRRE